MKKLISSAWRCRSLDVEKICKGLLQYRNTPCGRDKLSPAQKLFGHPVQDFLPAHRRAFAPEWQKSDMQVDQDAERAEAEAKEYHDQRAKPLKEFDVGRQVAVYNPRTSLWDIYGKIVEVGAYRRYRIKTQAGRLLVRNRRFLRSRNAASLVPLNAGKMPAPPPQVPPAAQVPAAPEPRRSSQSVKAAKETY